MKILACLVAAFGLAPLSAIEVDESYIVLYEHYDYTGATLTVKLRDGMIQTINQNNHLYARCSSFELVCPEGVRVSLHKWPPGHPEHAKVKNVWTPPDKFVPKEELEKRQLNDAITCIVWSAPGRPDPDPNRDGISQTGTQTDEPNRTRGADYPKAPANQWCVEFYSVDGGRRSLIAQGYVRAERKEEAVLKARGFAESDHWLKNRYKQIEAYNGYCGHSDVRKIGNIP